MGIGEGGVRGGVFIMKMVSYNTRGLGAVEKKRAIRKLCLEKRLNILCIQESKLEVVDIDLIRFLWGSDVVNFSFQPSVGASGGIITM